MRWAELFCFIELIHHGQCFNHFFSVWIDTFFTQALVAKVKELCDGNGSFLLSALDAFSTLCLAEDLQVCTCMSRK